MNVDTSTEALVNKKRRRTKTGCATCRIRRIKCDEGKPRCRKCTSTGRKCDGYSKPWPSAEPAPAAMLVVVSSGPTKMTCDRRARDAFHYFYEVSAPVLVNYGSHYFWNKLVLQACHVDESIKHLVIAAAALDREMRDIKSPSQTSKNDVFLYHYGKALRLIGASKNPNTGVILMACLLFVICDEFQKNRFGALQHIIAGRRIISNHISQKSSTNHDMTVDELGQIFQRLQLQTGELDQETLPRHVRWPFNSDRPGPIPMPFKSDYDRLQNDYSSSTFQGYNTLKMATSCLQSLVLFCVSRQPRTVAPYSVFHIVPNATHQLNQWLTYFNALCTQMDANEASTSRMQIHLLRTHHMCMSIMSRCAPFDDELLYDKYGAQFEHLCVKFAHIITDGNTEEVGQKLVFPAFFVATHHRDVAFRRRAVCCLRQCGWPGVRLATIAEQVAEIEEGDDVNVVVCDDVPEEMRIRVTGIDFARNEVSREAIGILNFERFPFSSQRCDVHQHRFSWPDIKDAAVQESVKQLLRRVLSYEFV